MISHDDITWQMHKLIYILFNISVEIIYNFFSNSIDEGSLKSLWSKSILIFAISSDFKYWYRNFNIFENA